MDYFHYFIGLVLATTVVLLIVISPVDTISLYQWFGVLDTI
jgi:hypothetical protein